MIRLWKQAHLFAPDDSGVMDILTAGNKVVGIAPELDVSTLENVTIIDCKGLMVLPGLIDGHAHIAGAGGEGGPGTRTPEMKLTDFTTAGVTTVIGMLGTDGFARHPDSVLMKARSLTSEGISVYMLTGSYQVPVVTITGDLGRDIILIPEILGAGEIAVSDHRDSAPQWPELARLAKTVRVAGMLAGKPGIVCLHLGDASKTFDIIVDAVEKGNCPWKHFLPTHCNRSEDVFDRAVTFGRQGGFIDLTTSAYPYFPDEEVKPSDAIVKLLAQGIPANHICLSSDAGGSLPDFDSSGNLKGMAIGKPDTLFSEIRDLVHNGMAISTAVQFASRNIADIFGLTSKGVIRIGSDADMVIVDETLSIRHVVAMGQIAVQDGLPVTFGAFEKQ